MTHSSVRAEWNLADLAGEEADPFETVTYTAGISIDLTASDEELFNTVGRLLRTEERMAKAGLTCDLKDAGQDCLTCPMATLDPNEPRNRLCRLGKDQSTVEKRYQQRQDDTHAPLRDLIAEIEQAMEVGQLDPELAELVTEVGL